MPIEIVCTCGVRYRVKDEAAGKKVRCKQCGTPIAVPTPQTELVDPLADASKDDLFGDLLLPDGNDDAAANITSPDVGPKCPACRMWLAPNAILCIQCGYNLTTGERVKTVRDSHAGQCDLDLSGIRRATVLFGMPLILFALPFAILRVVNGSTLLGLAVSTPCFVAYTSLIAMAFKLTSFVRIENMPDGKVQIVKSTGLGKFRNVTVYQAHDYDAVLFVQGAAARRVGPLSGFILVGAVISGFIMMGLSMEQRGLMGLMEFLAGLIVTGAALRVLLRRTAPQVSYRVELCKAGRIPTVLFSGGENSKHDARSVSTLVQDTTNLSREEEIGLLQTGKLGF